MLSDSVQLLVDGLPADDQATLDSICINPVPMINVISDEALCSVSLHFGDYTLFCNYPSLVNVDIVTNGFNTVETGRESNA